MITINDKETKRYKFIKFKSLDKFNIPFLMSALTGDNLYASRATAYKVNSNVYKNKLLKSLGKTLASEPEQTLIYLYKDKYNVPDSLGIFKIDVESLSLTLKDLLIKRDNLEFLEEFILLGIEIVKEIKGKSLKVEVPAWNLKLKKNLLSLNETSNFDFSYIGDGKSTTYMFEDEFIPNAGEFRDKVYIFEMKIED